MHTPSFSPQPDTPEQLLCLRDVLDLTALIPETIDTMWGTGMTAAFTLDHGQVAVFVAVDHASAECVVIHAALHGTRHEALEPVRQGVAERFGSVEKNAAAGLAVRHDHGSQYMSRDFRREIAWLGANILARLHPRARRQRLRRHPRRHRAARARAAAARFMGELQHRVKIILNNVRSLATQTRRRSTDLDRFFDAFMPRLAALSRAQDLLLRNPEDDVELSEIVRVELEAVGAERGRTYTADGPSLRLSPRDAQAIAMAVHELATNAGKYGALNAEGGEIRVEWQIERGGARELRFRWRVAASGSPTRRPRGASGRT